MKRAICAALFVAALSFADRVDASPLADGCAGGPYSPRGGCIHLVNGTDDPLWVHTVRAGVKGFPADDEQRCGYFKISQVQPDGTEFVIHTSARRCIIPADDPVGPTYVQDRTYAAHTGFCGWFTTFLPTRKGCVSLWP